MNIQDNLITEFKVLLMHRTQDPLIIVKLIIHRVNNANYEEHSEDCSLFMKQKRTAVSHYDYVARKLKQAYSIKLDKAKL
ncbi:hypothetical protein Sjap_025479 [Stephania japonica]|uniref:Uncharacterized protein n=1 Tax=Stephania japonica TaxID=461633 RepID=A0AAP0E4Y2_9MAGN